MRHAELALRKELALTRMRVARAELALARTRRPGNLATVGSAVDLASEVLEGRDLGRWGRALRLALHVAQIFFGARRALGA